MICTMDYYSHFLIFLEIFSFLFKSYSLYVALKGLLCYYLIYLILSCFLFGAFLYFRIRKPASYRVERILGKKWGAYANYASCNETQSNAVKVIGHRACGFDAPENSLSALEEMYAKGISMVEFDVSLTKDNVPVVFHDSNLWRMTDVNKNLSDISLKELKKLDISVKHPFGEHFEKEKVPTLEEFVNYCLENKIKMVIDLKHESKEMVKIINNLFMKYTDLYDMAIVSAFNPVLIYQIRANDPKIVSTLCWRPYYYSHKYFNGEEGPLCPRSSNIFITIYQLFLNRFHCWFLSNVGYYIIGVSALSLPKDIVTREDIRYWNNRGIRLIAWGVNLPSEKQYFENILQITYMTDTVISR